MRRGLRGPGAGRRLLLTVVLVAGLAAGVADAGAASSLAGQCGTVVQVPPPPSLEPGAFEASGTFRLIEETRQRTLSAPMAVDIVQPGLYDSGSDLPLLQPVIAAGTVVGSYLLHTDPSGQPQVGTRVSVSLTFDNDILGVAITDAALDAGDPAVGSPLTAYPTGVPKRGFELLSTGSRDYVHLVNRRTVELSGVPTTVVDEARIIVAGSTPSTSPLIGYRLVAADGGLFTYGNHQFYGSGAGKGTSPTVGGSSTCTGSGYWLVAADGTVLSFGDAVAKGSLAGTHLNWPIVGMAGTLSSQGYWLAASDGGVFGFGDAVFHGSTGAVKLNRPIVGIVATPTGGGYWLVASDGGIFSFGDAVFHGSTGAVKLNRPIVGMVATPTGGGYWLVASDGGIFSFGDAVFFGSMGGTPLNQPIVAAL